MKQARKHNCTVSFFWLEATFFLVLSACYNQILLFYFSSADTSLGADQEQEKCGDEVEELESAADDGLTDEDDSSTKGDKNARPENKPMRKRSNAADAIARDKAAKRKTEKMSNKQAVITVLRIIGMHYKRNG